MDRRELFGLLGAVGAESALGADHGADKEGERFQGPAGNFHAHFCGIHIAKKNPKFQIIAQHYCCPRGEDMHQCLLFDSYEKNARLLGVEYIVSDKVYRQLPLDEQKYWHPHTYEVLAGGLIAPAMKPEQELQFMKAILTTWGKTWHTWPDPTTSVPLGEPLLMWALTGDGQVDPKVLAARDKQYGISASAIREQRTKALGVEVPQVALPKSVDQVGRQWRDEGDDRPTVRK